MIAVVELVCCTDGGGVVRPAAAQGAAGHAGGEVSAVQYRPEYPGDAARVRVLAVQSCPPPMGDGASKHSSRACPAEVHDG
jgi:hypothetical protein